MKEILTDWNQFINLLSKHSLVQNDADCAARIRADLQRKGTPIGAYDLLIAGQALAQDLTLITHNVKEFARIPHLKFEDWL